MIGSIYSAQAYAGQSSFSGTHWGVDSLQRADQVPSGGSVILYSAVIAPQSAQGAGRVPEFWGRYIGPRGSSQLTQAEADFLRSNNCRILLIYNNTYAYLDRSVTPPRYLYVSTYDEGAFHAKQAINYIRGTPNPLYPNLNYPGLSVPRNKSVWIYLNTEIGPDPNTGQNFPVLPAAFYQGWSDTLATSDYGGAGGVYGNTSAAQASSFSTPYCTAYTGDAAMQGGAAVVFANQPDKCDTNCDPYVYAHGQAQPFTPTPLSPNPPAPSCNPGIVVYQYATNLPVARITNPQPVDYDVANADGFKKMWAIAWQAYVIDLHNDANNRGVVCAPTLERLPDPDRRLVAIMTVAHAPNAVADLGAYVSPDDGKTWAAPVELTNLPLGLPQTMVEWNGNILVFAGSNPIYQAIFDTTALAWVNFGTQQSPSYWRSWYAPGGTATFGFLRAARTFDRTQAAVTALSNGTSSPFIPVASDGTAAAAQTIPIFGTAGPLMLRWVGASPQVARMRPFDQLQYVSGQLYFDPNVPQYVDLYTRSGTTWSLNSTYTVDSLSKMTSPTNQTVMQVLRRGLWPVDYAWGPGTVAANSSDMYGFFSDNSIRSDAGGLSGVLSGRWRRQVGGVWTEDQVNFVTDATPPLNEQNYNLHSQAMWLHDNEFRAVIEMAGPTYPGNGHYWYVSRRV